MSSTDSWASPLGSLHVAHERRVVIHHEGGHAEGLESVELLVTRGDDVVGTSRGDVGRDHRHVDAERREDVTDLARG